jgi:exopolysaccharide production protein ExoZ
MISLSVAGDSVAAREEKGSKFASALANAPCLRHAAAVREAERLPCVDALRGVMALCVAAYHFASFTHAFKPGSPQASAIALLGIYSVQGFFIISGLCFFHGYGPLARGSSRFDGPLAQGSARLDRARSFTSLEAKRFYVRRFFRIAPLYYAVLLLNLCLGQAVWPRFSWGRIAENVTLSFGLFHPNHAMVLGGWSIGIECVFYLAFPLLLWLCQRRGGLLLTLLVLSALPFLLEESLRSAPEAARFHAYVRVPNHAFLFLLGALCAEWLPLLSALTRERLTGLVLLLVMFLLGAAVGDLLPPIYDHFALMYGAARLAGVSLCFVLVLLCALGRIRRPRLFAPFRLLGELSYAVYLLHPFAWKLLVALGLSAAAPGSVFCAGLALSLLLAALAHVTLERPLLALGKRLSARLQDPSEVLATQLRTSETELSMQA